MVNPLGVYQTSCRNKHLADKWQWFSLFYRVVNYLWNSFAGWLILLTFYFKDGVDIRFFKKPSIPWCYFKLGIEFSFCRIVGTRILSRSKLRCLMLTQFSQTCFILPHIFPQTLVVYIDIRKFKERTLCSKTLTFIEHHCNIELW